MAEGKVKIDEWSRIENDGSGDYYIVPDNLFNMTLEEAYYDDPEFEEKMKRCTYVGGFASCVKFRGEAEFKG